MAGSGEIRAGAAYVELSADSSKLQAGLDAAASRVKAFGASIAALGGALMAGGAAITAPLLGLLETFRKHGTEVNLEAKRLGMTAEAISRLGYAAARSGVPIESLELGLKHLMATIADAAHGEKKASEALEAVGLSGKKLIGMPLEEQFLTVADALSRVHDSTERAGRTMDIFTMRVGVKLNPVMAKGSAALRELMDESDKLGATVSGPQAAAAAALSGAWARFDTVVKSIKFNIGSALAPMMTELVTLVREQITPVIEWVRANQGAVISLFKLGAALSVAGAAFVALGAAVVIAGAGFGVLAGVIGAVGAGLAFMLTPLGLTLTALRWGATAWALWTESGQAAVADVAGVWNSFAAAMKDSWPAVVNALQTGHLQEAFEVITGDLEVEWLRLMDLIQKRWASFVRFIGVTGVMEWVDRHGRGGERGQVPGSPWSDVGGLRFGAAPGTTAARGGASGQVPGSPWTDAGGLRFGAVPGAPAGAAGDPRVMAWMAGRAPGGAAGPGNAFDRLVSAAVGFGPDAAGAMLSSTAAALDRAAASPLGAAVLRQIERRTRAEALTAPELPGAGPKARTGDLLHMPMELDAIKKEVANMSDFTAGSFLSGGGRAFMQFGGQERKSPEVKELEKINKKLDDAGRKAARLMEAE